MVPSSTVIENSEVHEVVSPNTTVGSEPATTVNVQASEAPTFTMSQYVMVAGMYPAVSVDPSCTSPLTASVRLPNVKASLTFVTFR